MGTISDGLDIKKNLKKIYLLNVLQLTAIMGYPGAWGKLIYEKNLKSKISWHYTFKEKKFLPKNVKMISVARS
jgi:hypothetical protein